VGIVRALFDYVDRLHAVMRWSESPFVLDRELVGIDELFAWMVERLESEAQEVGAKKSWNNDKKILALGIEGDALTICDGLREDRRSIEHHKAVAQIDVSLVIHRTEIHIDGTLVEGPGFEVSEGEHELSVTWIPFTYPYPKGSRLELDEEQVEEVVRTILNRVMPAMRISAITKMLPQAEVERTPEP